MIAGLNTSTGVSPTIGSPARPSLGARSTNGPRYPVFVGVDQRAVGVVVGVDAGLAGVEWGWWDPFDGAVVADADLPALFGEAVVRAAGQHFDVDVGLSMVFDPALDVMDLTAVARHGAAGVGASAVTRVQHDPLSW